jgi:hypothetical protein
MLCRNPCRWQHNLNQKASGKTGAVQLPLRARSGGQRLGLWQHRKGGKEVRKGFDVSGTDSANPFVDRENRQRGGRFSAYQVTGCGLHK